MKIPLSRRWVWWWWMDKERCPDSPNLPSSSVLKDEGQGVDSGHSRRRSLNWKQFVDAVGRSHYHHHSRSTKNCPRNASAACRGWCVPSRRTMAGALKSACLRSHSAPGYHFCGCGGWRRRWAWESSWDHSSSATSCCCPSRMTEACTGDGCPSAAAAVGTAPAHTAT